MAMPMWLTSNWRGRECIALREFFGGSGIDEATSMVLDPSGRVILSGYTLSSNFR